MEDFVDNAKSIYPSIRLVAITGGECFTLGEDLYRLIIYIHNKQLRTRIVTNGSWAVTMKKSREIMERLITSGLDEINFSTGDSHQQYVPIDRVLNGIIAAQERKIITVVNVESHEISTQKYAAKSLKQEPRLAEYKNSPYFKIIAGAWIPFSQQTVNKDLNISPQKILPHHHVSRCKQLFKIMTLAPQEELMCCCGLTTRKHPYLNLGSIRNKDIKELWESQFGDFMKIWLYAEGPFKILEFAQKMDPTIVIDTAYSMHTCALCMQILSNEKIINAIKNNYTKIISRVLLEYSIQTNIKNKIINKYENAEKQSETQF